MEQVLTMLTETPWPWIVLLLFILIIFFRKPIGRIIDRTHKAKAKAGKDGAEFEFESNPDTAPIEPKTTEAVNPIEPGKTESDFVHGVKMKDVLLDNASEIEGIEGNVDIDNLTLDRNSRIGKIKGK